MSVAVFLTIALLTIYNAYFGESLLEDPVPFPPAYPTVENILALCYNGNRRHRYPAHTIPSSWSSHFRRRATAITRLESWYQFCCSGPMIQQPGVLLCCTQQAWMQALSQFCVEEFSTMTAAYDCCRLQGAARWICFSTEPFNPSYSPTLEHITQFTPNAEVFVFKNNEC
ncbi:extracellular matrix protein 1 [Boleophthalmus pectinirostris]|uniref:extracellular matrix protein 1 n=1 Tax=Boleophthalmus pectinirostris TaxID=150288 RepID=UPI000A1C4CFC|nr:extracellular matrix protein 1 [Boleophthalmus pectinirostris]